MGVGSRRRYCDRPSVNAVSVGRRDDWTVWGRVLGIRKVDRPERVAVQREEDHAGTHVDGWRGVLPGKSVRPMGISGQKCRGPRTDPGPVPRDNIWVAARAALDHWRELLHRLALGLRRDDVVCPGKRPLVRADHL